MRHAALVKRPDLRIPKVLDGKLAAPTDLRQDLFDRIAVVDVQALLPGHLKPPWIEAQLMEHRGVNVGHVVAVLHGIETEFVGGAVDNTLLDSRASHPDGETVRIVIATISAFAARRAP